MLTKKGEKVKTIDKERMITVKTLGGFDVIQNEISLTKTASGSKKIWELYKFMLTHREKSYTPETLLNQLWISEEYSDPKSTLRRQMYRLRKVLNEGQEAEEQTILYTNGYYFWNASKCIKIDMIIFNELAAKGDALKENDPEEALNAYLQAIDLYEGDYLPDCLDQHWVFPMRNQLRRVFLRVVASTVDILKAKDDYETILRICEKAIEIDIYEESFHIHIMEAMLALSDYRLAFDHYTKITEFYEREMGIRPSIQMRNVYKRLLKADKTLSDQDDFYETLEAETLMENAFFCEPDVFKSIYELERRRSERTENDFSIGVIDMPFEKGSSYSKNEFRMNRLKDHLLHHLRKGDTICRWAAQQYVLLLPGVDEESMTKVVKRILELEVEFSDVKLTQSKFLSSQRVEVIY